MDEMRTGPSRLPALTTEQMRAVDRAMVEDYGIALIQMMENAGRILAHLARQRFLNGDPRDKRIVVLAGTGGNGGGGLVAARRLAGWGARVTVRTTKPDAAYNGVPAHQLAILHRMNVAVRAATDGDTLPEAHLVVDAIIGYSLTGPPRGSAAGLIRAANTHEAPTLSLDVPAGIDATTGAVHDPAVRAAATMTLALPKQGLYNEAAASVIGELYLADIGVPPALYAGSGLGLDVGTLFAKADILRLR